MVIEGGPRDLCAVTVVIPQRGQANLTVACVEDLRAHESPSLEIVVVDDGTAGEWSRERTALEGLGARLVSQPAIGVTAAWNRGWRNATGDIVAFVNNDVRVNGAFVNALSAPLLAGVARVSGVEWRWEGTTPGAARPKGRIPGWKCLAGYCFAVRKDWLAERGGFDERMRVYWSDTDLQWEARRVAGESALTRTETGHVLGHMGHRTARGLADRREVWKRDRDVFVKKWSGAR